jgi:hypothetical protein
VRLLINLKKNVALLPSSVYVINIELGSFCSFLLSVFFRDVIDDCPFLSVGTVITSNISDSESLVYIISSISSIIMFSLLVSYVVFVFDEHAKGVLIIFTSSSILFFLRKYTNFSLVLAWLTIESESDCLISVVSIGPSLHLFLSFHLHSFFLRFHGSVFLSTLHCSHE